MAIGIHFDNDYDAEYDTLGIGIYHREEECENPDSETLGIGFKHIKEESEDTNEK